MSETKMLGELFDSMVDNFRGFARQEDLRDGLIQTAGHLISDNVFSEYLDQLHKLAEDEAIVVSMAAAGEFEVGPFDPTAFSTLLSVFIPMYLRGFFVGMQTGMNGPETLMELGEFAEGYIDEVRHFLYESEAQVETITIEQDDDPFGLGS